MIKKAIKTPLFLICFLCIEIVFPFCIHAKYRMFSTFFYITGQLEVLSTNKPVNILCFKGNLLAGNYFCYGQIALLGHKTE